MRRLLASRSSSTHHAMFASGRPQFVKLSLASLAIDTVGFITSFVAIVVLHYSGWIAVALVLFYGVEFTYKVQYTSKRGTMLYIADPRAAQRGPRCRPPRYQPSYTPRTYSGN